MGKDVGSLVGVATPDEERPVYTLPVRHSVSTALPYLGVSTARSPCPSSSLAVQVGSYAPSLELMPIETASSPWTTTVAVIGTFPALRTSWPPAHDIVFRPQEVADAESSPEESSLSSEEGGVPLHPAPVAAESRLDDMTPQARMARMLEAYQVEEDEEDGDGATPGGQRADLDFAAVGGQPRTPRPSRRRRDSWWPYRSLR
ncbi:hypothetical protein LTR37_001462 [Vermiconidia calcicola]|uniref:Uncharacterized protein n=1 Tax=Vermiconidia calcicola TaxID=1690605 RepID=A0ACC3NXK4_9PEZI|nr:hypothetical protein LTR37_001462 [Vermiconidia calcicola]